MSYSHPDDRNLTNLHKAMTYNSELNPAVRTVVTNDETQPIPVSLGGQDVVITGNVTIPGIVNVYSTTNDPVHVHVSEIGTSGILDVPWMPIAGNVYIDGGNVNVTITSGNVKVFGNVNVSVTSMPAVEISNDSGNPIPVSANTSPNSLTNPIFVSTIGGSNQGKLWYFQVAQGLIPGTISVFKAGYNPSIANNTEESLWGNSSLYPWASWGAGGTLSCASASASDTGVLVITGLRSSDWVQVTETVTMTGVTPVVTSNSFIRINELRYSGNGANVGAISVSRGAAVVGFIEVDSGLGQMGQYTVPTGYTAYILTGSANIGKGNDGTGRFKYRLYNGSFQTALTFLLFQSTFNFEFMAPLSLPEKSDLDVTMVASVSGTACSCAYSIIIIAN